LGAQGQKPDRVRRVSVLIGTPDSDPETKSRIRAFRLGLRDAGWVEGRNIQIDFRYPGTDRDAISKQVAEATRSAPDVILANSTPVMAALRPATNTIPIVFVIVNDPVGQGFVSNLTRPGSSVTGFSFIDPEIVGKWIDLLTDVKPDLARLILLFNPDTASYYDSYLHSFKALPHIWYERSDSTAGPPSLLLKLLVTGQPLSIQVHPAPSWVWMCPAEFPVTPTRLA
jgi:putative ABC transport system substrate-binding protein